jgi:hypothetical protein
MRNKTLGTLLALAGALLAAAVLAGIIIENVWCVNVFPVFETTSFTEQESHELLDGLKMLYAEHKEAIGEAMPLAQPLRVESIHGATAKIELAKAMDEGNRLYADIWLRVFRKYHGRGSCVSMDLVWPSGGAMHQRCCSSDL